MRWLLLVLFATSGCSLTSVGDGLEIAVCKLGDCRALPNLPAVANPCEEWRCNLSTGNCEVMFKDRDRDGYAGDSFGDCARPSDLDEPMDCDDEEVPGQAIRTPNSTEYCDGIDNDCDASTDEGAYREWWSTQPSVPDPSDLQKDEQVFAVSSFLGDTNAFAGVFFRNGGKAHVAVTNFESETSLAGELNLANGLPNSPNLEAVAAFPYDQRHVVVASVANSGNDDIRMGVLNAENDALTGAEIVHQPDGPDPGPEETGAGPKTGLVAASQSDGHGLFAYVNRREALECKDVRDNPGEENRVDVIAVAFALDGNGQTPVAPDYKGVSLGRTHDGAPPALLSLGNDEFLIAFPSGTNHTEIQLSLLTWQDGPGLTVANLATQATNGVATGVAMARMVDRHGDTKIGLVYVDGCPGDQDIAVFLRVYGWNGTNLTFEGVVEVENDGTTTRQPRRPALVAQTFASGWREWVVSWVAGLRTLGGGRVGVIPGDTDTLEFQERFTLYTPAGTMSAPGGLSADGVRLGIGPGPNGVSAVVLETRGKKPIPTVLSICEPK